MREQVWHKTPSGRGLGAMGRGLGAMGWGLGAMGRGTNIFARGGMMVYNAARWCGAGKHHHGTPGEVPEWTIGAAC